MDTLVIRLPATLQSHIPHRSSVPHFMVWTHFHATCTLHILQWRVLRSGRWQYLHQNKLSDIPEEQKAFILWAKLDTKQPVSSHSLLSPGAWSQIFFHINVQHLLTLGYHIPQEHYDLHICRENFKPQSYVTFNAFTLKCLLINSRNSKLSRWGHHCTWDTWAFYWDHKTTWNSSTLLDFYWLL
jgi:hypothetical protein